MPDRIANRLRGTPLRTRLVGLLLILVAAALLLAGTATATALRGYLLEQVDENLVEMTNRLTDDVAGIGGDQPTPPGDDVRPVRPGPTGRDVLYIATLDANGEITSAAGDEETLADPPVLPTVTVEEATSMAGTPFTVEAASGGNSWRVVIRPMEDGSGSVAVAQDISGINGTVQRLVLLELAIGGLVLLALGVAGWFLVRRSLRPLEAVEHTAAAIAAGDLHRRAPTSDPRTEVGSLAHSFNTMVDDLAGALAAQQSSEAAARAAADQARASEARMRRFVADAGHELRTPLTSVRGFAELYRMGAVPTGAPMDDTMGRIEAEAGRMGVLVEDLLLLARMDQQRPLERTEVDVVDLVSDALAAAQAANPGRDLRLHVSDGAVGLQLDGDALRLRQVVDNLLSNALRYSPAPERVEVLVDRTVDTATIAIADRGPGMPPEVAARAFERFYRADPARSREDGGSGLGLAIVHAIVAAHGGRVALRTAPGQGCTVVVHLPLEVPANVSPSAPATPSGRQAHEGGPIAGIAHVAAGSGQPPE